MFVVQKNAMHPVKEITAKLQKQDLDIYEAHQRIDDTIICVQTCHTDIHCTCRYTCRCYSEAKQFAAETDSVEENPRTI